MRLIGQERMRDVKSDDIVELKVLRPTAICNRNEFLEQAVILQFSHISLQVICEKIVSISLF